MNVFLFFVAWAALAIAMAILIGGFMRAASRGDEEDDEWYSD